jgi:hypothetical protein
MRAAIRVPSFSMIHWFSMTVKLPVVICISFLHATEGHVTSVAEGHVTSVAEGR